LRTALQLEFQNLSNSRSTWSRLFGLTVEDFTISVLSHWEHDEIESDLLSRGRWLIVLDQKGQHSSKSPFFFFHITESQSSRICV
jgi:hypothetical protein